MFDHNLWTSSSEIVRTSPRTLPATRGMFNADRVADDDLFYRNISDKCIFQAVTACRTTPECLVPELATDGVSGYALTHQVLYAHVLKKVNANAATRAHGMHGRNWSTNIWEGAEIAENNYDRRNGYIWI